MGGDCFGDAVNVAARLLDHAGDNETLITVEVLLGLPLEQRRASAAWTAWPCAAAPSRCRCMCWAAARGGDQAATQFGDVSHRSPNPTACASSGWPAPRCSPASSMPVVLGRSPQATSASTTPACRARMRGSTGTAAASSSPTSATTAPTCALPTARSSACAAAAARCTAAAPIGLGGSPADPGSPASTSTCCALPTRAAGRWNCADPCAFCTSTTIGSTACCSPRPAAWPMAWRWRQPSQAPKRGNWSRHWKPDFLVIDLHLPDTNGYALLAALREHWPHRRCRPSCARPRKSATWKLRRRRASPGCWTKPVQLQTVLAELARRARAP
jgi:CheY-like chemotaxis protein